MLNLLFVIQFIICILLVFFVFLQKKEETTSLLSTNVYNSMFKSMVVPSNPLVKITLIIGVLFFINSIAIGALIMKNSGQPNQVIKNVEKYTKSNESNNPKDLNNVKKEGSKIPVVPLGN